MRAPLDPPEILLLGPGPSNPHPAVSVAMSAPLVSHLDPFFLTVMEETMTDLRALYQTSNHHTVPISATGTGGLETLMFNLVEPGDEVIVGGIGYFGQRLAELAIAAGGVVRPVEVGWGEVLDPEAIAREFERGPAKVVALVHAETSTGALQPLADIGRIVRENDSLLMVDAVTSLGGVAVDADGWLIDAAGSCSQKCLGAPPGLGPITVGPRAIDAIHHRSVPVASWYFDLRRLFSYWGEEDSSRARVFHHTAPIANIYGFREALRLIHTEGMEARFARHQQAHDLLVAELAEIGLGLFTPETHRAPMLNIVEIPEGVDDASIRGSMLERGIEISGAFGPLAGKAWRIGLMGTNATAPVVSRLVSNLKEVLGR
ncbi:MAG: alanine--glyoxylate aminotransferase family protein [bacterium]|nr:alanine--glyoxylate aminotransferase family protein [bacterium]